MVVLVIAAGPVAGVMLGWFARALWHAGQCERLADLAYDEGWDDAIEYTRAGGRVTLGWDGPAADPAPPTDTPCRWGLRPDGSPCVLPGHDHGDWDTPAPDELTQAWPPPVAWPDTPSVLSDETIAAWGELTTAAIAAYGAEYEALSAR